MRPSFSFERAASEAKYLLGELLLGLLFSVGTAAGVLFAWLILSLVFFSLGLDWPFLRK